MNPSYVSIFSIASMLALMVNSAVAQDRVQAGTLVCNTSMELGQRFLGSNHIRQPRRACTTMCG